MINLSKLPNIGMRNVKTAVSVLLCIFILRLFSDDTPFYACIAAVITMQNSVENSIKTGINRIIGTLIGAAIGVIFSLMLPNNILLTGLGITIVIYLTTIIKKNNSTTIACIVYLAIMVNIKYTSPMQYTVNRVLETLLGIVVSVGVNNLIFNPDKKGAKH